MTVLVSSCSTKKNTGLTRFWHGFTAKYNTYYNGAQAYIEGSIEKEKGNKDNFTERIPLYTVGNKSSRDLGKGNYDKAITKAQKAIQIHSIKARPEWTKGRKTPKDIEWLSRKEYNPFLWRAWMLMGRSQFYKGEFDEAAATFSYMSRLYKGQPAIYGKARAWLAKCFIESDWLYDAEDVIRSMQRDSIDWRAQKEWDYTLADYYCRTDNLPLAAEYLRKVVKHEMRSKQRAREYYLLGQIEAAQGHKDEAYKAFRKVLRQNPPYELAFNARISMTEVMAKGQAKKMIGRLKRMARNENNAEYLDQVYYAIGNIYLAERDTMNAVAAYEKGNEKATRTGIEKGVLLLRLGDLYWELERYADAQRCYGEAIGMLDKERPDYKQLAARSKVLDELVPYTEAVHLQDSLQELAQMSEKERNAAIDRVIDALKKKEKEEKAKEAEKQLEANQQKYGNNNSSPSSRPQNNNTPKTSSSNSSTWYFYNAQAVQQGKQTFIRQWGKRENVDDWQRYNTTVVKNAGSTAEGEEALDTLNLTQEQKDSLVLAQKQQEEKEQKADSAANDPHKREYYLAQIPFTEEQVAESNNIIKDGLYHSGVIFKDKLENMPLSEKAFTRLMTQYPEYEPKDELYYHLFLLYSRKGEHTEAKTYIERLKEECAESKYTTLLTDPYFEENARYGKHLEDSLYGATYEAFKGDRFHEVYQNNSVSAKRFPLGDNRDRFIFLDGLTRLNDGDADSCVHAMQVIVKDYPKSSVAEMAGMIINGVKEGRALHGAKFDLSDVWNRRTAVMEDAEKYADRLFSAEKNTDFMFLMAYPPDSLDENKLLFQMARYNFTSFLVRNFDIDIENQYGMHHMVISGFRNFDEARQYSKQLLDNEAVRQAMGKARPMIISAENLELIGTRYSYNDYDTFYVAHFAPLPVERPEMLYEPVTVGDAKQQLKSQDYVNPVLPDEQVAPNGVKPVEVKDAEDEAEEGTAADNSEIIAIPEEETPAQQDTIEEVAIPDEEPAQSDSIEEIAIPDEEPAQQEEDTIILDDGTEEQTPAEDDTIILDDRQSTDELEDEYYELDGF